MKTVLAMSLVALLFTVLMVPTAEARLDQYTISHLTFSDSFQLPGVTLPGGTYTFKRVSPGVIQVLSRDHQTLHWTFMTVPTLKWGHITEQEVVMSEARAGEIPRVETWWPFPQPAWLMLHRSVGYGFLY
jgi:hypothetical protein